MNLVRTGIILLVIGVILVLLPNLLMVKVYDSIMNYLSSNINYNYTALELGNTSYYSVSLYVNNPGYLVIVLKHVSISLNMSLTDPFGHMLPPSLTLNRNDTYLVTYTLKRIGSYSLLISGNGGNIEVAFAIASLSPSLLSYLLLLTVAMDIGTISIIIGSVILVVYMAKRYYGTLHLVR